MKKPIIYFRTRLSSSRTGIGSTTRIRSRGSEYESLRNATPTDDARDIAWKQFARTESLTVKSREDTSTISILLVGVQDVSWDFTIEKHDDKKYFWDTLLDSCEETSSIHRYVFQSNFEKMKSLREVTDSLREKKTKNHLIVIVSSSLDREEYDNLDILAKQNDIVPIHLLHPYERHPEYLPHHLIESSLIQEISYKESLESHQKSIRDFLEKHGISHLEGSSDDNPISLLNHFFKYRYV